MSETPTKAQAVRAAEYVQRILADYNGQTVEVVNKYHYSPDRWWITSIDGGFLHLPGGYYKSGSVYSHSLTNIREDVVEV